MVWATKSLERDREYVVIKHTLKDMNGNVAGVKFRGGYAVVEVGSKAYIQLKKLPLIKNNEDLPLVFLRKLPFITRTTDVKMVYGQDVYAKYLQVLHEEMDKEVVEKAVEADIAHVEVENRCSFTTPKGTLCGNEALHGSPSKYCKLHLLEDSKLESLGIVVPQRLTKAQKKDYRDKIASKLEKITS